MPPRMRATLRGSSPPRQAMITTPKPKYRSRIALRWLGGRVKVAWGSQSPPKQVAAGGYVHHLYPIVHDPHTIAPCHELARLASGAEPALGSFARPAFIIHHSSFCIPKLSPVCLRCVSGESPGWPPGSRRSQPPSLAPQSLDVRTARPGVLSTIRDSPLQAVAQGRQNDGGTESCREKYPGGGPRSFCPVMILSLPVAALPCCALCGWRTPTLCLDHHHGGLDVLEHVLVIVNWVHSAGIIGFTFRC